MAVHVFALVVLGLMCGSELNVALFAHPLLNRQALEAHIPMRSALARLLGRVMPFWMGGSTLLNGLLLLPFQHLGRTAWRLAAVSFAIQICAVVFSLAALVPINNGVAKWTTATLPGNWKAMARRWDVYNVVRTGALIVAFVLLAVSVAAS